MFSASTKVNTVLRPLLNCTFVHLMKIDVDLERTRAWINAMEIFSDEKHMKSFFEKVVSVNEFFLQNLSNIRFH